MVIKLEGTLNGNPIVFERAEGDWWKATVPHVLNGTYTVWLVATDDAGNKGYATKYLLTVNLNQMCVHLEPFPWRAELLGAEYCARALVSNYYAELALPDFGQEICISDYYAELMAAECGGCG